jgi:hypothetical protein
MRKIFPLFAVVASLSLVGCATEPSKYVEFENTTKFVKNGTIYTKKDMASGIRWNNDYVVTAKHVTFAKDIEYKSPGELDLQFVKNSGNNVILPQWRERQAGESVSIVGVNQSGKTKIVTGKDLDIYSEQGNSINYLTTAVTVGGQSGGPVFGHDGKVIGMLVAITNGKDADGNKDQALANKGEQFSLYIPYSVIEAEWNKFQKKS